MAAIKIGHINKGFAVFPVVLLILFIYPWFKVRVVPELKLRAIDIEVKTSVIF